MSAEIVKVDAKSPNASLIHYAASRIRAGDVVGIPTDTFYGLAVDPVNLHAVDRVYEIKSRSRHKPLSLLIGDADQADDLAMDVPDDFHRLAHKFWPGPLTMIVKASRNLPLRVTANTGNVALRVPDSAVALALLSATGFPITATSANLSGSAECCTSQALFEQLGERIPLIVDGGRTPRDTPSTIVDMSNENSGWRVIREGAITEEQIKNVIS